MRRLVTLTATLGLTVVVGCEDEPLCTLAGAFTGLHLTVGIRDGAEVERVRIEWHDAERGPAYMVVWCGEQSPDSECGRVVDTHERFDPDTLVTSSLEDDEGFYLRLSREYPSVVQAVALTEQDEVVSEARAEELLYDEYSQPNGARCDGRRYPFTEARLDL